MAVRAVHSLLNVPILILEQYNILYMAATRLRNFSFFDPTNYTTIAPRSLFT
jgi:hypothetical protein